MKSIVFALAATVALGACTTTQRVSVEQPGDRAMTCAAMKDEFGKLDAIITDGQHDQGVNGANVAAVLFFWPAAVGNYFSARDAMEIADKRKAHLMEIYNGHNCDNPANAELVVRVPASLLTPVARGMH